LKYNNNNNNNNNNNDEHNIFIALVATSFGHYGHLQANAIQNLESLITCNAQNVKLYGIPFTSMSIFVNSLKFLLPYVTIYRGSYCRQL
jgi:hypothetical protein